MNRNDIDKKFQFLRGKSITSLEKTADSFMNVSNRLWGFLFISLVSIPFSLLLKSEKGHISSIKDLLNVIMKYELILLVVLFFLVVGAAIAYKVRDWALCIYDYLDGEKEK